MSLIIIYETKQIQVGQVLKSQSSLKILVNKFDCCVVHIIVVLLYDIHSMICPGGCPFLSTYKAQLIWRGTHFTVLSNLRILANKFDCCVAHIIVIV